MKIAVAGASGRAGSEITKELSRRGHAVTAIARNPEKIAALPNVTPTSGTCSTSRPCQAVGRARRRREFRALPGQRPLKLIGAAKDSKVGRYLVVGGAGSLEVAPGVKLVTTPGFPGSVQG